MDTMHVIMGDYDVIYVVTIGNQFDMLIKIISYFPRKYLNLWKEPLSLSQVTT